MQDFLSTKAEGSSFAKTENSIMYLGQSVHGEELWRTADQLTTHTFVSGSTGSGKTETLINMMTNTLLWGSGSVFIDGKGDISFFAKMHLIAKSLGLEDNVLLLNFMKGNVGKSREFVSHTINPFGFLTADEITQIMSNMLPNTGRDGMWRERAVALMTCIINTLVWLRDERGETLTIGTIRDNLTLNELIKLRNRLESISAPWPIRSELQFYLDSLPGYDQSRGLKQLSTAYDQHGYLSMQWTRVVTLLCTTYGHIFSEGKPDIDIRDVILNRRTLIILLPSLERSSSDIGNIGSLMVGMLKSMLGQALRSPVEGGWQAVVKDRITNAKHPFMIFMDEVGQYLSDGMGMMAQQARSLNIGLVFSTQDFDSLYSSNSRETEAILSNTNTKIFMKAENPTAHQISRVLSIYTSAIQQKSARILNLNLARTTHFRDLWTYRDKHTKIFDSALRLSMDEISNTIFRLSREALEHAETTYEPDLSALLKGFKSGQMICTFGTDCIQGTSNYIALGDETVPYTITVRHSVSLADYSDNAFKKIEFDKRVNHVKSKLVSLTAAIGDTAPPLPHFADNLEISPNSVWTNLIGENVGDQIKKAIDPEIIKPKPLDPDAPAGQSFNFYKSIRMN